MNTGFCAPSIPFRSIHRLIQSVLPQLTFSFYRHQPIRTDFSGGQITCAGRASEVFAFYNDRGECENRIEEFKNGFRADRLSCHRFLANAFRLLLYAAAYNLVNLFRLQLPLPWRSAQIETLRARLFKLGARVRQTARCVRFHLATGWPRKISAE